MSIDQDAALVPEIPVQRAVLDGLHEMGRLDGGASGEIGVG